MNQLLLILELQWLLFKNSLRLRANQLELAARIIFSIMVLLFDIGVAFGLGVVSYLIFYKEYAVPAYTFLFTALTLYWQIAPLATASYGTGLSVSRFRLYPVSTQRLFLLDLFTGFVDPIALSLYLPFIGILIGAIIAAPLVAPVAMVLVFTLILFNVALGRYLQRFIEVFFASRRRKEIFILVLAIFGIMLALFPQIFVNRMALEDRSSRARDARLKSTEKIMRQSVKVLELLTWTPPGLAARGLVNGRGESPAAKALLFLSAACFPAIFLGLSYRRMNIDFHGRPGQTVSAVVQPLPAPPESARAPAQLKVEEGWAIPWLSPARAAIVEKELKYLYRSPRTLTIFASAVLISLVLVPVMRGAASGYLAQYRLSGVVFYALIIASQIFNNSFCFDSHGAKLFFLTPVNARDVLIGKNIAIGIIVALQAIIDTLIIHFAFFPQSLKTVVNTGFITTISLLLMLTLGNFISVLYPKTIEFNKMSGTAYSKFAILLTLGAQGLVFVVAAIGPLLGWLTNNYLIALLVFIVELIVVSLLYWLLLEKAAHLFARRADQFFESIL